MKTALTWHLPNSILLLCLGSLSASCHHSGGRVDSSSDAAQPGDLNHEQDISHGQDVNYEREMLDVQLETAEDTSTSNEAGSIRLQTDAFSGWLGGSCQVNSDCTNSPAAAAIVHMTCPSQIFCMDGLCHSECIEACIVVRADVNPCHEPRFCVAFATSGGLSFCRITPLQCVTQSDCPLAQVLGDGGAELTCNDGICSFPGFEYPTQ